MDQLFTVSLSIAQNGPETRLTHMFLCAAGSHPGNMAEKKLMLEIAPTTAKPSVKVTVVGTGQVGMAVAYSLMLKVCVNVR